MFEFEGRRLTGANFFSQGPLVIIDAEIPTDQAQSILAAWSANVITLHTRLQLPCPEPAYRMHDKGQSLYFAAPIDVLYSAIELSEFALMVASGERAIENFEFLLELYREEARPDLLALQQHALQQKVPFLWCDDFVSLGFGQFSQTWDRDCLPDPNTLDWEQYKEIPLAFVTGTNGKSTTTRLASQIFRSSGRTVGFSSTDGIWAGDKCLDSGDYSGPGGAREVLRNTQVQTAILEVARGGLLRRGVGAQRADVALITNVAEDHLGEYGVNTLAELIQAKFIVRKALGPKGNLILNADDPGCVDYASNLSENIIWFALEKSNPEIQKQIKLENTVFFTEDNQLCLNTGGKTTRICPLHKIPITFSGAAKHNVANALAASALCYQLGITTDNICKGLSDFESNRDNNPGRGNLIDAGDFSIMVDFAHNPHGLTAVVNTLLQMPAKRRLVMIGHAGDRSDKDIQDLTRVALNLEPELVIICEMEQHLRGRAAGEIPGIISETLLGSGMKAEAISIQPTPLAGVQQALAWAQKGDFLLLLALADRDKVFAEIDKFIANKGY